MADSIRTFTITIGKVYNGEELCNTPKVELAGKQHIAVNCIDFEGCKYQVQLGPKDIEPCLKFLATCEECGPCGTVIIDKCFCDGPDDCDECEICDAEGFCEHQCPDGICDNGVCKDCDLTHPCPCNQICVNGECKCPAGSILNAQGCCDDCTNNTDCPICYICDKHNPLYTVCTSIESEACHCDTNGRCGTPGACQECINSGHCPPNEICNSNCECDCAPGFIRKNGICVPAECEEDSDCGICEICGPNNICTPNQCPAGKVPAVIDGVCSCVPECDCDNPDCNRTSSCGETFDKCGCLPCGGNCTEGCEDPCVCIGNTCIDNPCSGDCTNALGCAGDGCGCSPDGCILCEALSCDDCATALGCKCTTGKCRKDTTCDLSPCSVSSDCGLDCTCNAGECVPCSYFSCTTNDCSSQEDCSCNGGSCEGDHGECVDEVTFEKDDDNCELTGKLVKDNCCQCPALTLDIKTTSVTDVDGKKRVKFTAEVRKGAYDGVNVEASPLVDNYDHPAIAENEPPSTGTILLSYVINNDVYTIINGGDYYNNTSSTNGPSSSQTYSSSSPTSQKQFQIDFPKIGTRTVSGQQAFVVKSIDVTFTLSTKMTFSNECEYPAGTQIGVFKITKNEEFLQVPIGNTITSPNCRKPLFKYTKSTDNSFDETPFRKLYIDPTSPGIYEDTFGGSEGAESCLNYLFETDCTCDDPISKYIVFCNPDEIKFPKPVLTNCGKVAAIEIQATCAANADKDYGIYVNGSSVATRTFKLKDPLTGYSLASLVPITSILLHMKCDVVGECDILYTYPENAVDPTPDVTCNADGTVSFVFKSASYNSNISSVTFDGVLSLGTAGVFTFIKQPNTPYDYKVVFANGCTSDIKTISKNDCCNPPTLTCAPDGKYLVSPIANVTYLGVPIHSSGIITPPAFASSPLTYVCAGETITIQVYPYREYAPCCNIVLSTFEKDADAKTITVAIGAASKSGNYSVTVEKTTGAILASAMMTNNGISHVFTVTSGVDEDLIVVVRNTADTACFTTRPVSFDANGCDLGLILTMNDDACILTASTDEKTCYCPIGKLSGSVSAVTSISSTQISATFAVLPTIENSAGLDIVSSTLRIYVNNVLSSTDTLYSLTPSPITKTINAYCATSQTATETFTVQKFLCDGECGNQEYQIDINIGNPYVVSGITIGGSTFTPLNHLEGETWSVYYTPGSGASMRISFRNTDTNLSYFSDIPAQTTGTSNYTFDIPSSNCYLCGGTIKGANIKLVYGVTLEDGCIYTGELSKQICVGTAYTLSEVALVNTNPSGKKMRFDLHQGSTLLETDFKKSPSSINYGASDVDFKAGQPYTVTASCDCEEEATTSECFDTEIIKYEPSGSLWGSNCNKTYGITINSCYYGEKVNVSLGGANKVVTLNSSGVGSTIFTLPTSLTSANVNIAYSYQVNNTGTWCSNTISIPNDYAPGIAVGYNCTDGVNQIYDATISVTGGGTVVITNIPGGAEYGTINGAVLEGITTTNNFGITVSINGSCSYLVNIYAADCSCNVTAATVANPTINICAFTTNNVTTTSDQSLAITVTRVDTGNDWWTALGTNTIGGGHSGSTLTLSIPGAQLLIAAPNSANIVYLKISDTDGGNACKTFPITINRTNVQYSTSASCGIGNWSIAVTSSTSPGVTLSDVTSGTLSGLNINNISLSTTSVTFKVKKGSCTSSLITVDIPGACAPSCDNSEISFTATVITQPCTLTGTQGVVEVQATTTNGLCPLTSATGVDQLSSSYNSTAGIGYIRYASNTVGSKEVAVAATACGCYQSTMVAFAQNCCGSNSQSVSISVSPEAFCTSAGGNINVIVLQNYDGYTLEGWSLSTGTWQSPPTAAGGTVVIPPGTSSPLVVSVAVKDAPGGNICNPISAVVNPTTCAVNLCTEGTGVVCPNCQDCDPATGSCTVYTFQGQQGPCDPGFECCLGACVADCVVPADSYTSGCNYNHYACTATDCGIPENLSPACYSTSGFDTHGWTCDLGGCLILVVTDVARLSALCPPLSDNLGDYTIDIISPNITISATAFNFKDSDYAEVVFWINLADYGICTDLQYSFEYNNCFSVSGATNVVQRCIDNNCDPCGA